MKHVAPVLDCLAWLELGSAPDMPTSGTGRFTCTVVYGGPLVLLGYDQEESVSVHAGYTEDGYTLLMVKHTLGQPLITVCRNLVHQGPHSAAARCALAINEQLALWYSQQ